MGTEVFVITNGDGQLFLDENRLADLMYSGLLTKQDVGRKLAHILARDLNARPYVYQLKYRADLTPTGGA